VSPPAVPKTLPLTVRDPAISSQSPVQLAHNCPDGHITLAHKFFNIIVAVAVEAYPLQLTAYVITPTEASSIAVVVVKLIPVELILTLVKILEWESIVYVGATLPQSVVSIPVSANGMRPSSLHGPTELSEPTKRCGIYKQFPEKQVFGFDGLHTCG
jgi:hypothetical protein